LVRTANWPSLEIARRKSDRVMGPANAGKGCFSLIAIGQELVRELTIEESSCDKPDHYPWQNYAQFLGAWRKNVWARSGLILCTP
jgi:hypothetical protein